MCSESTAESEAIYLTVTQRLQVGESTIYGWVDRDYIPFRMAGDLVRFDRVRFTNGCWRKLTANVKRNED
ncbi:MAG TPA: hypothetical protein VKB05_18485 [Pyrinomonadaceae bacterium]|nr:hypothetical protein [Pyrinomonadaceae bacterium]